MPFSARVAFSARSEATISTSNDATDAPLFATRFAPSQHRSNAINTTFARRRLGIDVDNLADVIAKENEKDASSMVYAGDEKGWVENAGKKDIVAALKYEYGRIEEAVAVLKKKKAKLGKKLQVKMGGYAKKAEGLRQAISDSYQSAANAEIEVAVYERLRDMEGKVLGGRLKNLQAEVAELEATQSRLQAEWSDLHSEQ